MFSRLMKKENIGAVLVLIGMLLMIGAAGSCDIGAMSFLKAIIGAFVGLGVMGLGAVMIGGEAE